MKIQLSKSNCWIDFSTQRLPSTFKIPVSHLLVRFGESLCKAATKTMEVPATGLPKAQSQEVLTKIPSSSSLRPVSIPLFRSWPWSKSHGTKLRVQLCDHRMTKTVAKQVTEFVQALTPAVSLLKPSWQQAPPSCSLTHHPRLVEWGEESKIKPVVWDKNSLIIETE